MNVLKVEYSNFKEVRLEIYLELVLTKTKNLLTIPIDRILFVMLQDYREWCLMI